MPLNPAQREELERLRRKQKGLPEEGERPGLQLPIDDEPPPGWTPPNRDPNEDPERSPDQGGENDGSRSRRGVVIIEL